MKHAAISIALMCAMWPAAAMAVLDRPYTDNYPNPYALMYADKIETEKGTEWTVFSNRANAPIVAAPEANAQKIAQAEYMEPFQALERNGQFLKVKSTQRQDVTGWIDMRHLILTQRSIIDPETRVRQKVFLKVQIRSKQTEKGVNALRFREGPGKGSEFGEAGTYRFLTKQNEIATVGTIFYYVYGVAFNDANADYQNIEEFDAADYFLIGDMPSFAIGEDKTVIRGWISRDAAIFWDTRQGLEKIPNRPKKDWDAHKFSHRTSLSDYFALPGEYERQQFLNNPSNGLLMWDIGGGTPPRGQDLRDLILRANLERTEEDGLVSEYIGFSGEDPSAEGQKELQQKFAALQNSVQNIDIFFLVDATKSMVPSLNAAARVMKTMGEQIKQEKQLKVTFKGAMYRDEDDVYKDNGKNASYDECPDNSPEKISAYFCPDKQCGGNAFSSLRKDGSYDDYPEDVFNAMEKAIDAWQFSDPNSVRVMVILGDDGDHDRRASSPGRQAIIDLLKEKQIFPFAIQFLHPLEGIVSEEQLALKKQAEKKFVDDFRAITSARYNSDQGKNVFSLKKEELQVNMENNLLSIFDSLRALVTVLPDIRTGSKPLWEEPCEQFYKNAEDRQSCNNACAKDFNTCLDDFESKASQMGNQIMIEQIKKTFTDPTLAKVLSEHPELAFSTGYIALTKPGGTRLTRPVLLLGRSELEEIFSVIDKITGDYRSCENSLNDVIFKKAMLTILGELLQIKHIETEVSNEDIAQWFGTSVIDPNRTFLGYEDFIQTMCHPEHAQRWLAFLDKLERAKAMIDNLLHPKDEEEEKKMQEKLYTDLTGQKYYWVYPDEIFPSIP